MRHFLLAFALALFFGACADNPPPPAPEPQKISDDELKLILIKSQNIRFYDFGTLNTNSDLSDKNALRIELRVFKLGKPLGSFVVTKSEICYTDFAKINDCAPKWVAARSFFGDVSYGELFEDIFLQRDIFDGQGKRMGENGTIIQEFTYGGQKIYFERSAERIYFKNFTNGVIVSIENYKK